MKRFAAFIIILASSSVLLAQVNAVPDATAPRDTAADDAFSVQDLPPLRRVVFYNSGVAHMQHRGEVDGKAKLEIRFSSHDVDDVLKSLVFEDRGGGQVRAVEYQPAPNPEDVAANEFVPMTLAQLLQKYRGESIRAHFDNDQPPIQGKIFGLENRQIDNELQEFVVLVDSDGGMRSVMLNHVDRVEFDSQDVRDEMTLALTGITKSRKANQKRLDLLFDGRARREVAFGYVVDAPIWRMSYRLEVQPEQIQLQGWTHINNVTGVDWENVRIELRSGQPQAFHADLFAPVLAERDSVGLNPFGLPQELTLVHQWYGFEPAERFGDSARSESGAGMGGMMGGMGGGMMGGIGGGFGGGGGGAEESDSKPAQRGIDSDTAFQQIASLDRTASMIRFQLDDPVNLASGKSAALPVFRKQLPSRLLSVVKHQPSARDLTAIRSIELTNATDFSLVPGPISVSRDGDFVGDARIPRLAIGATTLLPYAIDRAILVSRTQTPVRRKAVAITVEKQQVVTTYENRFEVQFVIDNQDKDARQLIVEYQLPREVSVDDDAEEDPFANVSVKALPTVSIEPEPKKRSGNNLLTYEVATPALAKSPLTLRFRWTDEKRDPLRNILPTRALAWLQSNLKIDDTSRQTLEEFISVAREILNQQIVVRELSAKKTLYASEQTRVRENIRAVGAGSAAAEPFLQRMNEMETGILRVGDELEEAKKKLQSLEAKKNRLGR